MKTPNLQPESKLAAQLLKKYELSATLPWAQTKDQPNPTEYVANEIKTLADQAEELRIGATEVHQAVTRIVDQASPKRKHQGKIDLDKVHGTYLAGIVTEVRYNSNIYKNLEIAFGPQIIEELKDFLIANLGLADAEFLTEKAVAIFFEKLASFPAVFESEQNMLKVLDLVKDSYADSDIDVLDFDSNFFEEFGQSVEYFASFVETDTANDESNATSQLN